jgi:hypothetical protein
VVGVVKRLVTWLSGTATLNILSLGTTWDSKQPPHPRQVLQVFERLDGVQNFHAHLSGPLVRLVPPARPLLTACYDGAYPTLWRSELIRTIQDRALPLTSLSSLTSLTLEKYEKSPQHFTALIRAHQRSQSSIFTATPRSGRVSGSSGCFALPQTNCHV